MWPVLLRIGPITIYSFGVFLALGFFVASFVVWKQARSNGFPEEKVLDSLFLTTFLSLILARLGYIFFNLTIFSPDWSRALLFFKYPGLSFPVLILSAFLVSGLAARAAGLAVLWFWDIMALASAFLAIFANFGCFLDGCFSLAPRLPVALAILAVGLTAICLFLARFLSGTAELADVARRRGIFFLCYLIFQLISLLMTTWWTGNQAKLAVYAAGLVIAAAVLVFRYKVLFKYVYRRFSQRRSLSN